MLALIVLKSCVWPLSTYLKSEGTPARTIRRLQPIHTKKGAKVARPPPSYLSPSSRSILEVVFRRRHVGERGERQRVEVVAHATILGLDERSERLLSPSRAALNV